MLNKIAVVVISSNLNTLCLQIIKKLIDNEYFVFVLCNDEKEVERCNAGIQDAMFICGASTDSSKLKVIYSAIEDDLGKIDLLLHITEFKYNSTKVESSVQGYKEALINNAKNTIDVTETFAPMLKNSDDAHVINLLKISGKAREILTESMSEIINDIEIMELMSKLCMQKVSTVIL